VERHATVGGEPVSASLFDAGLFLFHNARELTARGSGPYLYLAKLEGRQEAALWHDVLSACEDALGLPRGTVRVTVLIETILAAFEMDEILWALGEHATGLNAGRWDYIFSTIKKFRSRDDFVLPDRAQVTMTVPFMRAYTELLVRTCHRRRMWSSIPARVYPAPAPKARPDWAGASSAALPRQAYRTTGPSCGSRGQIIRPCAWRSTTRCGRTRRKRFANLPRPAGTSCCCLAIARPWLVAVRRRLALPIGPRKWRRRRRRRGSRRSPRRVAAS